LCSIHFHRVYGPGEPEGDDAPPVFEFLRRIGQQDVNYIVETSTNLIDWVNPGRFLQVDAQIVGGAVELVNVTPQDDVPVLFFRIRLQP